jgi:hypothetical protein
MEILPGFYGFVKNAQKHCEKFFEFLHIKNEKAVAK